MFKLLGLQDDQVIAQIIHMQAQADLDSLEDHKRWYEQWKFPPKYFQKARDAFDKYLKTKTGQEEHLWKVEDRTEEAELEVWGSRMRDGIAENVIQNASDSLRQWFATHRVPSKYWDKIRKMGDDFFTQRIEEATESDKQALRDNKKNLQKLQSKRKDIAKQYAKSDSRNDWWKALDQLQAEIDRLVAAGATITATDRDQALEELKQELDHIAPIKYTGRAEQMMQYQHLASRAGKTDEQIANDLAVLRAALERDIRADPMLMDIPHYRNNIHQAIEGTIQALRPDAANWPIMEFGGTGTELDPLHINREPTQDEMTDYLARGITYVSVFGRVLKINP